MKRKADPELSELFWKDFLDCERDTIHRFLSESSIKIYHLSVLDEKKVNAQTMQLLNERASSAIQILNKDDFFNDSLVGEIVDFAGESFDSDMFIPSVPKRCHMRRAIQRTLENEFNAKCEKKKEKINELILKKSIDTDTSICLSVMNSVEWDMFQQDAVEDYYDQVQTRCPATPNNWESDLWYSSLWESVWLNDASRNMFIDWLEKNFKGFTVTLFGSGFNEQPAFGDVLSYIELNGSFRSL